MSTQIKLCNEGSTTLVIPAVDEPRKFPVFFNPRGALVRDVSITCCKASVSDLPKREKVTFADSLAGVGARGIRIANEVREIDSVFLNDISSSALDCASKSVEINSVRDKCHISRREACSFLLSRDENEGDRFDFTDIDPFGTPSDFVDCAIRSVKEGGVLSMTSTDSAVLCGVYPMVALRKYLGYPLRTEYSHEVGVRLMLGLMAQTAMRLETGIEPLFSHHYMHYFRVYASIRVGNAHSRKNDTEIGFILHCFSCGYRTMMSRSKFFQQRGADGEGAAVSRPFRDSRPLECPVCGRGGDARGGRLAIAGPLWIGKIFSGEFTTKCRQFSELAVFHEELDLPLYYDLNSIRLKSGSSMPRINLVANKLRSLGFLASRTRMNPTALRTDARMEDLRSAVHELAH